MTNPLLESQELSEYLSKDRLDYFKLTEIVYELFRKNTGLDANVNIEEFHKWLIKNECTNKVAVSDNSYRGTVHPLFIRTIRRGEFSMFIDLHCKISALSQPTCTYCTRGTMTKSIHTMGFNIAPMSQNAHGNSGVKKQKLKAFKKAIREHFLRSTSEFNDEGKLCVAMLFVFGKHETDKDCDNMAKALNDGLNGSLIADDVHIDHLNIMKIKTTFETSFIKINIRESNLNKHFDVLIKNSHYEPMLLTRPINPKEFLDNGDKLT